MADTRLWNVFETMNEDECRRLLQTTDVGRLALTSRALPVVLPVEYRLDGGRLLVRTPSHHELGSDIDGQIVGFQADALDGPGAAWCVSVTGLLRALPDELPSLLPGGPWFAGGQLLELQTDVIIGHRAASWP